MTEKDPTHPLAPQPGSEQDGPLETENSTTSVNMRGAVEVGTMRLVLFIGIAVAVVAMAAGYLIVRSTG